jgi:hypothetical protein
MNTYAVQTGADHRANLVKRGRSLEDFTIVYNSLEGFIALVAGLMAGSTVGVCASNPHAPSHPFNNLASSNFLLRQITV